MRPAVEKRKLVKEDAMRAASLRVSDAGDSSDEEGAVWDAAVRHVWKWKKQLYRGGREGE